MHIGWYSLAMADVKWPEVTMSEICCPDCQGNKLQKYGTNKTGLQKYRCMNPKCRRQFVAGSDHRVDEKTKALVKQLLAKNIDPRAIAEALIPVDNQEAKPPISLRWIYELRRRMKLKHGGY